jgi:hypothetical protein
MPQPAPTIRHADVLNRLTAITTRKTNPVGGSPHGAASRHRPDAERGPHITDMGYSAILPRWDDDLRGDDPGEYQIVA